MKLAAEERQILSLLSNAKSLVDDEMQAHMARYICVRASGYLENVFKSLIEKYHDKSCSQPTKNYINKVFSRVTNLDDVKLKGILKDFNEDWVEQYNNRLSGQCIASINSIVHNRHQIAHGNANTVGLSLHQMETYFKGLQEGIQGLEVILSTTSKPAKSRV